MNESCQEGLHYCPNCDRSIDVSGLEQRAEQLQADNKELEDDLSEIVKKKDQLQAKVERLKRLPLCPWCDPKEGGYAPCPMHNGCERAYEFIDNKDALFERERAKRVAQQLADQREEVEKLKWKYEGCHSCGEFHDEGSMCPPHEVRFKGFTRLEKVMRHRDQIAKQLAAQRAEIDQARVFLERCGYRRCDIPACNCGLWHGGHAEQRLADVIGNWKTFPGSG